MEREYSKVRVKLSWAVFHQEAHKEDGGGFVLYIKQCNIVQASFYTSYI